VTLWTCWLLAYDAWLPWQLGGYLLGLALGGGAAFGLAEGLARRWGSLVGLCLGLALSPLALLAGEALLSACLLDHPLRALQSLSGETLLGSWRPVLLFMAGAACLAGPLLLARLRGRSLAWQTGACLAGALGFGGALLLCPPPWGSLDAAPLGAYLVLVPGRALLWPSSLWIGDRVADHAMRALGQASTAAPLSRPPLPQPTTPAAGRARRQQARQRAREGDEHAQAERHAEAAAAYQEAFELWPAADRALGAARALAACGELQPAVRYLSFALQLPGGPGRAEALADPTLASVHDTDLLTAESRAPASLSRLVAVAGALTLALLSLALPFVAHPRESGSLGRLRLLALTGSPPRQLELGRRLAEGGDQGDDVSSTWIPSVYSRLDATPELDEPDYEGAAVPLLRAAERGDRVAMHAYAELREWYGDGADRSESVSWWRKAAEAGHLPAMRQLAWVLETGWGGAPRDAEAAARWYLRAAGETGDLESTVQAARLLEEAGLVDEALRRYRDAAAKGHPGAQERLAELE